MLANEEKDPYLKILQSLRLNPCKFKRYGLTLSHQSQASKHKQASTWTLKITYHTHTHTRTHRKESIMKESKKDKEESKIARVATLKEYNQTLSKREKRENLMEVKSTLKTLQKYGY